LLLLSLVDGEFVGMFGSYW